MLALGATGLLLACVLVFPRWLYPPLTASELDGAHVTGKDRLDAINNRLKLQNDARTTMLQGLGGAVILLGAWLTYRQLKTSREQLEHTIESGQQQHDLDLQGQITERFTRAIDQLGSEHLDVRLGGIYALERIARDSERDHEAIVEILTAFLREHADRSLGPPGDPSNPPSFDRSPADVTAALEVLGRRADYGEQRTLDLRRIRVKGAHLEGANLRGALLRGAELQWTHLQGADLLGARLSDADLRYSDCREADLRDTYLDDAKLNFVKWDGALLGGARLHGASYNRSTLTAEQLSSAEEGD